LASQAAAAQHASAMTKGPVPYRPRVFISYYSRGTDAKVAKTLREALSKYRVRVAAWRDREDLEPGSKFILSFQKALATCNFFVLLLSPRSIASPWCRREWLRALRLDKHVIVLYLHEVPPADWPLELEGLQYIDVRSGLAVGLGQLLKTLGVAADEPDPLDDPLDRDAARMDAFARFFFYCASNPLLPAANAKVIVRQQGPAMLESARAKDIIECVCVSNSTNCRELGDAILNLWNAPAPVLPPKPRAR
jgi:hypothetical protein